MLTRKRLWLALTVAIVAWEIAGVFMHPDLLFGTGSARACLPGTYYEHVEQESDGSSYPTSQQIDREMRVMSYYGPDRTVEQLRAAAEAKLTTEKFKSVRYFGCSTWFYLIKSIFHGLLWSLLAAMLYLLARRITADIGKEI